MALSPTSKLWMKSATTATGKGRTGLGAVSLSRLPSTKLGSVRAASLAVSVMSSLATTDLTVLKSERKNLALTVGVKVIPHPDKVAKGGEDAYFISSYDGGVVGVADGVSGWAQENVDPALFSKELMAHALAAVESEEQVRNDPRKLLAKAHSSTASIGAATAIIAILERRGILHVANLGDCGLRIIRQGKIVCATAPQQHYFDCPFQLSSESAQTADDATVYKLGVIEGDTIVMGSDGLFDNVYDSEIESTMQIFGGSLDEDSVSRAALALASVARTHAGDRNYDSPYAKEAILKGRDLPWWYKVFGKKIGGKIDDITVVVGHIVSKPLSAEEEVLPDSKDNNAAAESEQAPAEEQIPLDQQVPAKELNSAQLDSTTNLLPEGLVSTDEQIPAKERTSTDEQIPAKERISTDEEIPAKEWISADEQIPAKERISTDAQILAKERISTEAQIPAKERISIDEQIPAKERTSTDEQIPATERISTDEQIPAKEMISTDEQESQVS